MPIHPSRVPSFDDLPRVEGMPQGCAWGIFDQAGQKDKLGTLNYLTPEIVKAAAEDVRLGVSVSLNWPMNCRTANPFRKPPEHKIIKLQDVMPMLGDRPQSWDDEVTFNTQLSSQWDSLCHVQDTKTGMAYNGVTPILESFAKTSTADNDMPTLDHWHAAGCMTARGILIDFMAYAQDKGLPYHPLQGFRITKGNLEACAIHQGVEFKPGDVMIVRTGMTEAFDAISAGEPPPSSHKVSGLDGCDDMARWIWNKRFVAVASDNYALEALPGLDRQGNPGGLDCLYLHQYLLSSFGMPIGELWDLARLSQICRKTGKYSFMLTSAPLNLPCLIGSPANAIAIL